MKLQASCDVENVTDFKKYYEGAYVECRNGSIVRIDRVAIDTEQVLYRSINTDIFTAVPQPMAICTWEQMTSFMVFGKIGVGMFDIYGVISYCYQPNNRTGARGYHQGEYSSENLGGMMDPAAYKLAQISPVDNAWYDVNAYKIMRPVYRSVKDIKISSTFGVALSSMWAIVPEHTDKTKTPRFKVMRRKEHVGWYNVERQEIIFGATEYKQYAPYLINKLGVQCRERKA